MIAVSNGRPIAAMDATWLGTAAENLMVIESVMWFDTPVDWHRLAGVVRRRRVARYPVFRQRPGGLAHPAVQPRWEDAPTAPAGAAHRPAPASPIPAARRPLLERYVEAQISGCS